MIHISETKKSKPEKRKSRMPGWCWGNRYREGSQGRPHKKVRIEQRFEKRVRKP